MGEVLVTGGSGFFGGILKQELLARGYAVTNVDIVPDADEHDLLNSVRGDIRDRALLDSLFKAGNSRRCSIVRRCWRTATRTTTAVERECRWNPGSCRRLPKTSASGNSSLLRQIVCGGGVSGIRFERTKRRLRWRFTGDQSSPPNSCCPSTDRISTRPFFAAPP